MMFENQKKEIEVSTLRVSCDGEINNSSEGHPLIWLQIDEEKGMVNCPYCEKKFIYEDH